MYITEYMYVCVCVNVLLMKICDERQVTDMS